MFRVRMLHPGRWNIYRVNDKGADGGSDGGSPILAGVRSRKGIQLVEGLSVTDVALLCLLDRSQAPAAITRWVFVTL